MSRAGIVKENDFWFWLLVLITLAFWIPNLKFQPPLSTGDQGRDLYAFWMTRMGQWPCRDYWWQYGPLAPLYYGFFFLIGGVNLLSIRMGLAVIYLVIAILAYRTLLLFTHPFIAFLGSLAFLSFDMAWTFNHIVTFPFLFLAIFCVWKFFLSGKVQWCYGGMLALAGMGLVKMNISFASFAAFLASLLIGCALLPVKLAWKHFIFLILSFSLLVSGAHLLLYWALTLDWVNQCVTASPVFRSWTDSPTTNLKHLILRFLLWDKPRLLALGAFLVLGLLAFLGLKKRRFSSPEKKIFGMATFSLVLFGIANSVEYLLMEGLIDRFDFWIFPIAVFLAGLLAQGASFLFPRKIKLLLGGILFFLVIWFPFQNLKEAFAFRVPERYLDLPHGKVFLGGPLASVETLKKASHFIAEHTSFRDEILAIPYDALFCFLSGRRQAVREIIFYEQSHISMKQEGAIIQQLESKQVPLVLISSQYRSQRGGIGHLGKTHLRKLSQYIYDNYDEALTLGPWGSEARDAYAVKILQRRKKPVFIQ